MSSGSLGPPTQPRTFSRSQDAGGSASEEFPFDRSTKPDVKQGDGRRVPERPKDWSALLASHAIASAEFMENVEDLPAEERSFFGEIANDVDESTFTWEPITIPKKA